MAIEYVSIRAFGRGVGKSDTFIRNKCLLTEKNRNGFLVDVVKINETTGRPEIHKKKALKQWVDYGYEILGDYAIENSAAKSDPVLPLENFTPQTTETQPKVSNVAKLREASLAIGIREKELNYKKKAGLVVSKEEVYAQFYELGSMMRAKLEGFGDMHAARLADLRTEQEVKNYLDIELEKILLDMTKKPRVIND